MGFCLQLKLLLWKNFTLKKRKPIVLIFELFIPLVLFFILLGIRKKQPAYPVRSSKFSVYPLPSAGVIAVMQAFCDNGQKTEDGFYNFPNSMVTEFLSKLNNISQRNNFFQPDFTPNDLDEIPDIYKSIIEDPVAVHDSFSKAADMQVGDLIYNRTDLVEMLTTNFSLPKKDLEIFLNSSVDAGKLYTLLFGKLPDDGKWKLDENELPSSYNMDNSATENLNPLFIAADSITSGLIDESSLKHLYDLLGYLEKNKSKFKVIWNIVEGMFDVRSNVTFNEHDMVAVAKELKEKNSLVQQTYLD